MDKYTKVRWGTRDGDDDDFGQYSADLCLELDDEAPGIDTWPS